MLKNYFLITLRNLLKQKSFSFINIFGLSVGLTVCMLISLWVIDELSYDQFHANRNNLYRVIVEQKDAGGEHLSAITQFPLAAALNSEFPEIINTARYFGYNATQIVKYKDKISRINNIGYADKSFLGMFSFQLEFGDRHTALDNANSIILSKAEARNFFGDVNPVGEILIIDFFGDQREFMVTGVLKDELVNSHLKFNALVPFHIFNPLFEGENLWNTANNYFTYVQLAENVSYENVNEKISNFLTMYIPASQDRLFLQSITDIHLTTNIKFDTPANVSSSYISFFGIISVFVIVIACINFMNLSTARAEKRSKEIGLRKVIGAQRKQIVAQFFGEAFLFTLIAFIISLILVEISLPLFNNLAGKAVNLSIIFNNKYLAVLIIIIISTAFFAGIYPAMFLSSLIPVDVLRRKSSGSNKGRIFRKTLVTVQFTLAIILIAGTLIVSRQLNFMRDKDLGFDKENVVYIQIPRSARDKYEAIKNELLNLSEISSIGVSNILPIHGNESNFSEWDGNTSNKNVLFNISAVDEDYFKTLGIKLSEGRFFSKEFPADLKDACIINEEAVKQMEMENPLGKEMHGYKIIGVVENYHYMSLHNEVDPIFLRCAPQHAQFVFIKIKSDNFTDVINKAESVFRKIIPDAPFDYNFLDETIDNLYKVEIRSRTLFSGFTFFAVFISCLGLLGLIIFMVEKRTREIGVRKVLGASITGIVNLLLGEFVKLIIVANLLAWPVAYYLIIEWLRNFAYKIEISIWSFIISGLIALMIALATAGYQTIKAAIANPIDSLRYE